MAMTGYGIPQDDIAIAVEVAPKTLRKHYAEEIQKGAVTANAKVVESLYKSAVDQGNVTAQIWWTKCRLGWKEAVDVNLGAQDSLVKLMKEIDGRGLGLPREGD